MTHPPQAPDHDALPVGDEIDEVLSRANPNPNRVGCPPKETLSALARRAQPIDDPAYEHLVKCSPCYREFRALQDGAKSTPASLPGGSRSWMLTAAAVLFVSLAGVWWLTRDDGNEPETAHVSVSNGTAVQAQLDLRKFSVTRNEAASADPAPVELSTQVVYVSRFLPVGAEPGTYDVQVLDADLRSRSEGTGSAVIVDFVTTLRVRLNLVSLAPGAYQLAVRRQGDSWRMFPASVRQ